MTSGTGSEPRGSRAAAGFSLLEMVITLAIIGILSGYFMLRFSESQEEQLLQPPASKLRLLSQQAMRSASAYREDYTMFFTQSEMALARGRGFEAGGEIEIVESIPVPSGVTVMLRLAGDEKWVEAEGDLWHFRPAGLCEPIEVRFAAGEAFVELAFDPLTARAEETSYYP